jgi:hypothetical protein
MNKTHTGTLHAWLSKDRSLEGFYDNGATPEQIVSAPLLTITPPSDAGESLNYWEQQGYTYLGTATVTLTVESRDKLVEKKVDSLRAMQGAVRAKAHAEETAIERQIQKLLAIGCDEPVVVVDDDGFPF